MESGYYWVYRPSPLRELEVAFWDADNEYWQFVGDPEEYGFRQPPDSQLKVVAPIKLPSPNINIAYSVSTGINVNEIKRLLSQGTKDA